MIWVITGNLGFVVCNPFIRIGLPQEYYLYSTLRGFQVK